MYYQLDFIKNEEILLNNELLNPLFNLYTIFPHTTIQENKNQLSLFN